MKLEDIAKMAIDEVEAELKEIGRSAKSQADEQPLKSGLISQLNMISGEELFLRNLKERILVLFEGLNALPKENLENRLDLTLKFLEFVLANVENRLENMPK